MKLLRLKELEKVVQKLRRQVDDIYHPYLDWNQKGSRQRSRPRLHDEERGLKA